MNRDYIDMSGSEQKGVNPPPCELCVEASATHKCKECEQIMCKRCCSIHKKIKSTAEHTVDDLGTSQCADAIQEVIAELSETKTKLRNEIENTSRKQSTVRDNVTAVKREIQHFASAVKTKCDELCIKAEENGNTLLEELDSQLELFQKREDMMEKEIEEVTKLLNNPSMLRDFDSIAKKIKPYSVGVARIRKSLLDKSDTWKSVKLVFIPPCDGKIEKELILHMHPEDDGNRDSGMYMLPICCEKEENESEKEETEKEENDSDYEHPDSPERHIVTKTCGSQASSNPFSQTGNKTKIPSSPTSPKPDVPPRPVRKVPSTRRDPKNLPRHPSIKTIRDKTNFTKYIGKTLEHDKSIEDHQSCFLTIISDEVWVLTQAQVFVYSLWMNALDHLRKMDIKSLKSGKMGLNPTACARNSDGLVVISFCRSSVGRRQESINGLWTMHRTEGHVIDKLASNGYVNVACSDRKIIGLRAEFNTISIHEKTGDAVEDWSMVEVELHSPSIDSSLIAFKNCIYYVDRGCFVAMNEKGDIVKRRKFPKVDNPPTHECMNWHICDIDTEGRIIVCEQATGRVFLLNTDEKYSRIHFGEVGSDLEYPTQAISDFEGNIWIHEQTVYGDMISKFLLP